MKKIIRKMYMMFISFILILPVLLFLITLFSVANAIFCDDKVGILNSTLSLLERYTDCRNALNKNSHWRNLKISLFLSSWLLLTALKNKKRE